MSKEKQPPKRSTKEEEIAKAQAIKANDDADNLIDVIYNYNRTDADTHTWHLFDDLIKFAKDNSSTELKMERERLASLIACLPFRLREWDKVRPQLSKIILDGLSSGRFHDESGFRETEPRLAARSTDTTIRETFSRARKKLLL